MKNASLFRFAIAGLIATLVHVVIAWTLIDSRIAPPATANGAAYLFATAFSYLINTLWSFSKPLSKRYLVRFLTVSAAGGMVAMALAKIADTMEASPMTGIFAVVLIVPLLSYLAHKHWTYQ